MVTCAKISFTYMVTLILPLLLLSPSLLAGECSVVPPFLADSDFFKWRIVPKLGIELSTSSVKLISDCEMRHFWKSNIFVSGFRSTDLFLIHMSTVLICVIIGVCLAWFDGLHTFKNLCYWYGSKRKTGHKTETPCWNNRRRGMCETNFQLLLWFHEQKE